MRLTPGAQPVLQAALRRALASSSSAATTTTTTVAAATAFPEYLTLLHYRRKAKDDMAELLQTTDTHFGNRPSAPETAQAITACRNAYD